MPRWMFFAIFFVVALTIVSGIHYYIYRRIVVDPALPAPWGLIVKTMLIVLAASIPISFALIRLLDNDLTHYFVFPVYVWLGVMLLFFFTFFAFDIIQAVVWIVARISQKQEWLEDPSRRAMLARAIALTSVGTVLTSAGLGIARGLGKLIVRPVEVVLPKLPKELDGFTIVQLTDLHLGPMRGREWMEEVVRRTNALKPDLVAVTGDLVDGSVSQLAHDVEPLKDLKSKQGTFFVTGNHEYFVDLYGWLDHLESIGIRVLSNERVSIEKNGASFDLAGVDDHDGGRLALDHGVNVPAAMDGYNGDRAVVLLAHQPRVIDDAAKHDVGLVLSGHTHGGQIWPWGYLVYLQQPYVRGLHDHNGTQIYVSEGTGFWGPPMRLGSTSEITKVTLRSPEVVGKKATDSVTS